MHKQQNYMTIRLLRLLILGSIAALTACNGTDNRLLSAKQATSRYDLVGGPVAYADINDFVLENDKVRVAILGTERSWGPGILAAAWSMRTFGAQTRGIRLARDATASRRFFHLQIC